MRKEGGERGSEGDRRKEGGEGGSEGDRREGKEGVRVIEGGRGRRE